MNKRILIAPILCAFLFCQGIHAQDIDQELGTLGEKLTTLIKDAGKKKVAVLDFEDLQGNASELGKYIAEQLTVNLVMAKREFSVLDRANLRKILAEHKLTATGLIDPENAKKLGMFAGVDALVFGTIIPKGNKTSLTTKIVTTDTAELVGAARAEFQTDQNVQQLESRAARENIGGGSQLSAPRVVASKDFGNLSVQVTRFRILKDGFVTIDFTFQNKSAKTPVAVAFYHEPCFVRPCTLRTTLTAANGERFDASDGDLTGVGSMRFGPDALTEVEPGGSVQATLAFQKPLRNKTTAFTLQSELIVNQSYDANRYANYQLDQESLPPGCKLHNLMLELPLQ